MIDKKELRHIHTMFHSCAPLFIALGDEIRQQLIMEIADAGIEGINVSNLTSKTHLSRPAISHHLKVLKDCGLIQPKKMGTQIFYQLNLEDNLEDVNELVSSILKILGKINSVESAAAPSQAAAGPDRISERNGSPAERKATASTQDDAPKLESQISTTASA